MRYKKNQFAHLSQTDETDPVFASKRGKLNKNLSALLLSTVPLSCYCYSSFYWFIFRRFRGIVSGG
jgi:hypothetical protein